MRISCTLLGAPTRYSIIIFNGPWQGFPGSNPPPNAKISGEIEEVYQGFEELCGVLLVFKVLANLSYFEMVNRGG
jgi:hypothetical protein